MAKSSFISRIIRSFICNNVGYFDGELKKLTLNHQGGFTVETAVSKKRISIIVVSRNLYTEKVLDFPIEEESELKKILAIEYGELCPLRSTYNIVKIADGKALVNLWQFNKEVPPSLMAIPESFLVAMSLNDNDIGVIHGKDSMYITRIDGLIYSLKKSSLINTVQKFLLTTNRYTENHSSVYIDEIAISRWLQGLKKTKLSILLKFIALPNKATLTKQFFRYGVSVCLAFIAYLSITSSYLIWSQNTLEEKLSKNSSEVTASLNLQQSFDSKYEKYNALNLFMNNHNQVSNSLPLFIKLFPYVKFTNIRFVEERIVLRGSSEKATDVLDILSTEKVVMDAKFDFPTRRDRNKDIFVISFKLDKNHE